MRTAACEHGTSAGVDAGVAEAIGVEAVLADRQGDHERALRFVRVANAIEEAAGG